MTYQNHRYNAHGSWVAHRTADRAGGPSALNSPHLATALAQIDRAFGGSKVAGGKA